MLILQREELSQNRKGIKFHWPQRARYIAEHIVLYTLPQDLLLYFRHGLKNASGTRLQVNGAAYGQGIYLSPLISTSMGYSRMGYSSYNSKKNVPASASSTRFLSSDNITCIAICEVITSNKLKKNNAIWVCAEPDHVCTRFFFVYENGQVGDSSINTQESKYLGQIQAACR